MVIVDNNTWGFKNQSKFIHYMYSEISLFYLIFETRFRLCENIIQNIICIISNTKQKGTKKNKLPKKKTKKNRKI